MQRRTAMNYNVGKSKISKKFVLEEEEDEDVEGIEEIKVINNHIYYYSDVSIHSILNLTEITTEIKK